ncbi:MAG: tRNA (guanine(10)-N(2))-dimethyltransferase [Candidatus Heimdallarchaeaceae archaeon]
MNKDRWFNIKEGKTSILLNKDAERIYDSSVFYNPKMELNRDITLLQIYNIAKRKRSNLRFLDPFAGSGIRSFRILNELPPEHVEKTIISDIDLKAIENIEKNVEEFKFSDRVSVFRSDAFLCITEFLRKGNSVDIIDLDPFGSPISFIDIAVRALEKSSGYLFATATDMQVLCGKEPSACLRLYSSIPTNSYLCHEVALRILIYNILVSAGRIGVAIKPFLSFQFEHFYRIHVQLLKGKEQANVQFQKIGFVYLCEYCVYYEIEKIGEVKEIKTCPICRKKLVKIGPIWLGELGDKVVIKELLQDLEEIELTNKKKIEKILSGLRTELDFAPMFYSLPLLYKLYKKSGLSPAEIIEKVEEKGFSATRTIFDPQSIRTDAPYYVLHDIIKAI